MVLTFLCKYAILYFNQFFISNNLLLKEKNHKEIVS